MPKIQKINHVETKKKELKEKRILEEADKKMIESLVSDKKIEYNERYRSRNFCLTSFKPENYELWEQNWEEIKKEGIQFLTYQLEQCKTTEKIHIQGYMELEKAIDYKTIQSILRDKVYLARRKGTQSQAIAYVNKEDTRIKQNIKLGIMKSQGERTDIKNVAMMLLNGATPKDILEEYPDIYLKMRKNITQMYNDIQQDKIPVFKNIEVIILWGVAGAGKNHYVYSHHDEKDIYELADPENGTLWWDGYTGQKVVIIDEFDGWIKRNKLLKLTDGYCKKIKLPEKGGFVTKNWETIYLLSNKNPENWFECNIMEDSAFKRRINKIIHFTKPYISVKNHKIEYIEN
jgi:hypothetical protein